jgi:thiol-disulfide isomerase/thioredoxin
MRAVPIVALVIAAAATIAGVVVSHDRAFRPEQQTGADESAASGGIPSVTEMAVPACPAPLPGVPPVPKLAGVMARCLGSSQPIDVGAAVAGEPTLLNLWASWCAPCREEMPVLDDYADTSTAVRVVGINVRDRASSAAALVRDLGIGYASFTDADDVGAALEAPPLLPLSYLVNTDGSVRRLQDVLVFRDVAQIEQSVAAALGERRGP